MSLAAGGPKPTPAWRRGLYVVGMALGLLLFGWQLWSALGSLRQSGMQLVSPASLLAALGLAVAGYLLQLGGWLLAMRFLSIHLTAAGSFAGYFLSFLPRYVPGTVWGYLGRSEWLLRYHAVGYRKSSTGSLLEAGSFVATALLAAALAYLATPWQGAALLLLASGFGAGWLLLRRAAGGPLWRQWGLVPLGFLVYGCYWFVQGLSLGAVCRALGIAQGVDLLHLVAAAGAGWSVGFLTLFVPAGFGVRELSITYLLTTQSGAPPAEANLVAVLSRVCMIVAELLMLAAAVAWRLRAPVAPIDPQRMETSES